jgi:hypothetical protein
MEMCHAAPEAIRMMVTLIARDVAQSRQQGKALGYSKPAALLCLTLRPSSADPINKYPGFKATLHRIAGNGVHYTIVENRFARDLTVQLTGHDFLRGGCGVMLVRIRSEIDSNQRGL